MFTTANMALTSWDQRSDNFDHTQLTGNWNAIDQHDHSVGRGVQIGTPGIQPGAVTSPLIATGAVGNAQLAANAVGTTNIQPGAITNALIAAGAVSGADIATGAVTYTQLDVNVVPLGTVMMWYRASGNSLPGGGWEVMDGRPWSSIVNSLGLATGNIPDMRGTFAQGADVTGIHGPTIGATGGANTASLAHSHNVNPHSHTVPAHTHPITSDGSHMHLWQGGLHVSARTNCFDIGLTFKDSSNVQRQDTFYSLYIQNLLSNPSWLNPIQGGFNEQVIDGVADMDNAGSHSHGGSTQVSGALSTGDASSTTDIQLGSVAIVPQYVGLLYIMRVR